MRFVYNIPYVEVTPLQFGMSVRDVTSLLGPPSMVVTTKKGELDYRYTDCSIRFSVTSNDLVEVIFYPSADLSIEGVNLFSQVDSYKELLAKDGGTLEFVGVLLLPKYGITLTGFHDSNPSELSITVFTENRMDHLLNKFKPYIF